MFTFDDYKEALKSAGPKLTEEILRRAEADGNLDFLEFKKLADLAYPSA